MGIMEFQGIKTACGCVYIRRLSICIPGLSTTIAQKVTLRKYATKSFSRF